MTRLDEDEHALPLLLTASNDAAEDALRRGQRAESLFAFKHRLGSSLDPARDRDAKAQRIVHACVLASAAASSLDTGWSARAKTTAVLRELAFLDEPGGDRLPPTSGYAAAVRSVLRTKLGDHGRRDLPHLVRSASRTRVRELVGTSVLVRGVYRFSPDDLALLAALQEALAGFGGDVTVEVPGSSQQRLDFTRVDPFGPLADAVAKALQSPPTFVETTAALGHAGAAAEEGRIRCISARDEWGAAEATVEHIQAAFRSGKVPLSDIAVVLTDLESAVLPPLLATLAAAQIPALDPRGFEVEKAEVIWAASSLVDLALASTPRDLAELFASPAIDIGIDLTGRRDLQNRLRASSLVKIPNLAALYEQEVELLGPERARNLSEATRAVVQARTRGAAVTALTLFWSAFGLARSSDRGATGVLRKDTPPDPLELRELHVVAREGAYMRALTDALGTYRKSLERLSALESAADAAQTTREILALLPQRLPPLPAARVGQLKIVTFAEASGAAARYVVVADAAHDAGRQVASNTTRAWEFSAELWGLVHATRRTTFVVPSFLAGAAATPWEELATAPRTAGGLVRPLHRDEPTTASIAARSAVEAERERYFLSPRRIPSATVGQLPRDVLLESYVARPDAPTPPRPMPVTTLEAFATCAFRGYAEHVLSARDRPSEGLTLAARDEGALLHELCAEAFERTRDLWAKRPRPSDEILDALESIVDRHVQAAHIGSLRRVELGYARILARQVLLESILDEEWDYTLSEQAFGASDANSWPALELPGASAMLSGRIDRIDVSRDRKSHRVIDYKRGKQEEKLVGVTALQLPLYARVVEEKTRLPVLEGSYWRLVGKGTGRKSVAPKTWASVREDALQRAEDTFARTREGNIEPRPHLAATCQTCAVSGVCRRPPFAIPELSSDP